MTVGDDFTVAIGRLGLGNAQFASIWPFATTRGSDKTVRALGWAGNTVVVRIQFRGRPRNGSQHGSVLRGRPCETPTLVAASWGRLRYSTTGLGGGDTHLGAVQFGLAFDGQFLVYDDRVTLSSGGDLARLPFGFGFAASIKRLVIFDFGSGETIKWLPALQLIEGGLVRLPVQF